MSRTRMLAAACAVALSLLAVSAAFGASTASKLTGTVGPGFTITLKNGSAKVTTLKAGTYKIVVADNDRFLDLGGVAALGLAGARQPLEFVRPDRRAGGEEVARVGVARHEPECLLLAAAADQDSRSRPLDRPRRADRLREPVVAA